MPTVIAKFIRIQSALKDRATEIGDSELAEAITDCLLHVQGGNIGCPLGQIALAEYAASGVIPKSPPAAASLPEPKIPLAREQLLNRTQELLIREEKAAGHAESVAALELCEHYRFSSPLCPIFARLNKSTPIKQ